MNTAVLPDGVSYNIPSADVNFFKELAARMKWEIVDRAKKTVRSSSDVSHVSGQSETEESKNVGLEQAMALMDTMMVQGGNIVPSNEDANGALAHVKYDV